MQLKILGLSFGPPLPALASSVSSGAVLVKFQHTYQHHLAVGSSYPRFQHHCKPGCSTYFPTTSTIMTISEMAVFAPKIRASPPYHFRAAEMFPLIIEDRGAVACKAFASLILP